MRHNGWDHALKVTADGTGLVGYAEAVLLREAADQVGRISSAPRCGPASTRFRSQAPRRDQQEHTAGHPRLPAPLRAANVRFWVTMWPRSMPVSAASAIR